MAHGGGDGLKLVILAVLGYIVWRVMTDASNSATNPLEQWALAIQSHEGYYPGSVSFRNNNPGNLKFANQAGATGADAKGFAVFPDYETGFDALVRQLQLYVNRHPEYSLLQQMTVYLGGDPLNPKVTSQGDPFAYAADVAGRIGASVTDTLGQLFGGGHA